MSWVCEPLTVNQAMVLLLHAQGRTLEEIGTRHGVTADGSRHHLKKACKVLGAANVAHAVAICFELGIFEPGDVEVPAGVRERRETAVAQAAADSEH